MKGKAPTAEEKRWHDAQCELGCIVCLDIFGIYTPGTVHHMDGRTKPGSHMKTLCLCGAHHQVASDSGEWATRHGPGRNAGKTMFEAAYGTEEELLQKTRDRLEA
jgi:hypothetical protein